MYLVKGVINDFGYWGNPQLLRRGTVHFLPNTEVYLSHFYSDDNGVFVKGYHRNGLLKKKRTSFKCLKSLSLEKVENLSPKTIKFIEKNQILTVENYGLDRVSKLIYYFEEFGNKRIDDREIDDRLFINAVKFTTDLQQSILHQIPMKEILNTYFKFPLTIINNFKGENYQIDEKGFINNQNKLFTEKFKKSILDVDLKTIFPTYKRMFIGEALVTISNQSNFKIATIEQNSYTRDKNY